MNSESMKPAAAYKYITHSLISVAERERLREGWLAMWYGRMSPVPLLFICQGGTDIQPLDPSDADTIAEWVKDRMGDPKNVPS